MEHMSTKEKMKDMNIKEKTAYIWEYYKFHIIGAIILVAIVASFITDARSNKVAVLNVTALGQYMDADKIEALQNKATTDLVKDPKKKKEIKIDFLIKGDNPADQYSMASLQKLQAEVAAKDIDILILDRKDFELFANQGMFMKLSNIPELSQLNIPDKDFIKYRPKDAEGKEGTEDIYGINVENMSILKDLKYDTQNKILCIVSNTQRLDKSLEFLKWFFSQKSI